MNLKSIKSSAELKLDGIGIECEFRDKQLSAVTFTDKSGTVVRVALNGYSQMQAYVPAPPEMKTVHVVSAKVRVIGTPIREEFEDTYAANSRRSELEQADVCDEIAVKTEDVEIPF